jgi:hypothetical protein
VPISKLTGSVSEAGVHGSEIYGGDRNDEFGVLAQTIEKMLADDVARPIIGYNVSNTCWDPKVKGITLQVNSIYNGWRFEDAYLDK